MDFIMDRGFTSSEVYSEIFKREFDFGYLGNIKSKLKPKVFILSGRNRPDGIHYSYYNYASFSEDPVYSNEEKQKIDKKFTELADRNGYTIIEVFSKSPLEICNEILECLNTY